jgi:anti-sigma regulatory factor (Ser/Thr protein kinase)
VTTLVLPPDTAAVREARKFVQTFCRSAGMTEDVCDTAVLLASEAVTNAFVHGRSDARLAVTRVPGGLLVEVGDDNSRHPRQVDVDDQALDGRGLMIITALAARWGVRDEQTGKTVWFEVRAD